MSVKDMAESCYRIGNAAIRQWIASDAKVRTERHGPDPRSAEAAAAEDAEKRATEAESKV